MLDCPAKTANLIGNRRDVAIRHDRVHGQGYDAPSDPRKAGTPQQGFYRALKRTFDLTMSLIGIIVLSPIMAAIAIAMVISGEGGVIFAHRRLGRLERPFSCYKFRTMRRGAPLAGTHDVSGSWVTPVGKFLRATKLDELPQLFNVLAGDMSLVGPRPCLPNQLRVIEERRKVDVFSIRPGMTGLAQLQGIDMSSPEQLAHADNHYMQTRSMAGDVELIMMTVFPPLRRARFEIK